MTDATSARPGVPVDPRRDEVARRPARVRLAGELRHPGSFDVARLRELPQRTIAVEFGCLRDGPRRHTFTGPPLFDLVSASGPRFDPSVAKSRLRFLLAVTGADGHTTALLATTMDGRALDADGPHLAVPGDLAGGRYISRITGIWVGNADIFLAADR